MPVLNGINHDEELLFVAGLGLAVSGGTFVPLPAPADRRRTTRADIAAVLGVSAARAAAIAAEYPLGAYPSPVVAFSTAGLGRELRVPGAAGRPLDVEARADVRLPVRRRQRAAALRAARCAAAIATHSSEIQYLFDQPNAPVPATLNADQEALAASMRTAWANFAAERRPVVGSSAVAVVQRGSNVLSLVSPQPQVETTFAPTHHCSFWAAG